MADELVDFQNDDTQSYAFCRLKLVVKTFWTLNLIQQPIKIPSPKLRKRKMGTSVINSPLVLVYFRH